MKNTSLIAIALLFTAVANAQTPTQPTPTQPAQPATPAQTPVADTAAPASTTTVLTDTSVGKAYVTNPSKLQGLTSETITAAHIFPALGSYKASGTSTADVTVSLDETNKGIVWVEGLEQGKFKAIMKKAPSTYKVPAQKTESGKSVAEGTLYVNPETNELTIVLGRSFDDTNPMSFQTTTTNASKKSKAWQYTGVKADAATQVAAPASQQQ